MLLAFVGFFLREDNTSLALVTAVMWGGLLRAREALSLRHRDLALPQDPRLVDCAPGTAGVLVRRGKTGPMQVALLDDVVICSLLSHFFGYSNQRADDRLFSLSYARLISGMQRAASFFGLDVSRVSSHSCRHGGALHLFLRGVPTSTIASRGR